MALIQLMEVQWVAIWKLYLEWLPFFWHFLLSGGAGGVEAMLTRRGKTSVPGY